jgi:class 3 adenylate cyclase/predicted ATPase
MSSLEEWLAEHGLAALLAPLARHGIDLDTLGDLTEGDLREIGLSLGDRKRLMRAMRDLAPPQTAPRAMDAIAGGFERRPMTVLFCDIVGSSALTAELDPEDLVAALQEYRSLVSAAIARYQGFVARFVGDGVLAYFGFPVSHDNDAERAVRSALAITKDIASILLPGGRRIAVRIGIATGMVVVGDLFAAGHNEPHSVVGTAPNLAAALQNVAQPDGIVIAPTTHRLVQGFFRCESIGPVQLKGNPGPLEVWHVIEERPARTRFRALNASRGRTPFVGRAAELARLGELWARTCAGRSTIALILGDAGMGKSRLLEEFALSVHGTHARHTALATSPFGATTPLAPLIDDLRRATEDGDDLTLPAKRMRLEALAVGDGPARQRAVAAFASILSLPEDETFAAVAPDERKRMVFDAVVEQFDIVARQGPVLVTLEDLHWLDPSSMALLERIFTRVEGGASMLVVTSRRRPEQEWIGARAETITLGPLPREASAALVAAVSGSERLTREQTSALMARAGGVPLFLEEFARALAGSEAAEAGDGAGDLLRRRIPATLQESLAARLDRAGSARPVAQIAAVLAAPLETDLIARIGGIEHEAVVRSIDALVDAEILERAGERLIFRHALLRDAAYGGLMREQRRDLHRRAAEALAEDMPELVEAQPDVLARHLLEAGAERAALVQLVKAARHALRQSGLQEAAEHLQRGLDVASTLAQDSELQQIRLEMMGLLGPTLFALRGPGSREVEELYAGAVALCRSMQESRSHFPVYWGWWRISRDFHVKQQRADELLRRARRRGDPEFLLQAHHCSWASAFSAGALCACAEHIDKGLAIYAAGHYEDHATLYGNHDAKACGHGERAFLLWHRGDEAGAWSEFRVAQDWTRRLDHLGTHFHNMDMALVLGFYCREHAQVLQNARRLVDLADQRHFAEHKARGMIFQGWALAMHGELSAGRELLEQGLANQGVIGTIEDLPLYYAMLSEVMIRLDRAGEAGERLAAGCRMFDEKGVAIWIPELLRLQGESRLLTHGASDAQAIESFGKARLLALEQGSPALALRAAASQARAWSAVGRGAEAAALIREELARTAALPASRERREAEALARALGAVAGGR